MIVIAATTSNTTGIVDRNSIHNILLAEQFFGAYRDFILVFAFFILGAMPVSKDK